MARGKRRRRRGRRAARPAAALPPSSLSDEARPSQLRWWLAAGVIVVLVVFLRSQSSPRAAPEPDVDVPTSDEAIARATPIPEIEALGSTDPAMAQAVRQAVTAVRRNPQDGEAWGHLGRVYDAHRYVDLARSCYQEAVRLDPDEASWPYYLAVFAIDGGRDDDAVRHLEATLERRDDYLPALYRLGSVHLEAGRMEAARRAFDEVVSRAPELTWGHLGLARIAYSERRLEEAAARFEKALELEPDHRETAYLLAMTDRELGRDDAAAVLLASLEGRRDVLLEDPYLRQLVRQRSDLQERMEAANRMLAAEHLAGAEEIYQAVLSFDPDHFDAHHNLGVLLGQSGRFAEAESHIEKAKALRPESAAAHFSLAMVYLSTDRQQQAVSELRRTLELDPRHAEARRTLEALSPQS